MKGLVETLKSPIITDSQGNAVVTVGTVVTLGLGALALYLFIPEKKRKNLF